MPQINHSLIINLPIKHEQIDYHRNDSRAVQKKTVTDFKRSCCPN